MGILHDEAVKAQENLEEQILADPNVVSIGVIEEKNQYGRPTGDFAVQVGVISLDAYMQSKNRGNSVIPDEYVVKANNGSLADKRIHIIVIKEGKIEALFNDDLPSAIDNLDGIDSIADNTMRSRPSLCGVSIGHSSVVVGTLGLLVECDAAPNMGKAYLLSNNSGLIPRTFITHLYRWFPPRSDGLNIVDVAIAEVVGEASCGQYIVPHTKQISMPVEVSHAQLGMNVEKVGRTTGYTQGRINSVMCMLKIQFPGNFLTFREQIRTTSMPKPGNSGACLVEQDSKNPVGLLFAGSESATFHNPMRRVLDTISIPSTMYYPTKNTHTFSHDFPLRVLRRLYSTKVSTDTSVESHEVVKSIVHVGSQEVKPTAHVRSQSAYRSKVKDIGLLAVTKRPNRLSFAVSNQVTRETHRLSTRAIKCMTPFYFFKPKEIFRDTNTPGTVKMIECRK